MFYHVKEKTVDSTLPISVDDVKNYLRVEHNLDDAFIEQLIKARTNFLESITGRTMRAATVEALWFDVYVFYLDLPYGPIDSVLSVKTDEKDFETSDVSILDPYTLKLNTVELIGTKWLSIRYTTTADDDPLLKTILLKIVAYDYQHKDNLDLNVMPSDEHIENLIRHVRRMKV